MRSFKKKDIKVLCWYYINKGFVIYPEFFNANNIISDPFIQYLKRKPKMVHDLSIQMKIPLKNRYWRTVSNIKYTKSYASLAIMVKQNNVEVHMQKMMSY